MPAIVKVIAHTKFIGVPDDLWPIEKAKTSAAEALERDAASTEAFNADEAARGSNTRQLLTDPAEFLSEPAINARAIRIIKDAGQDDGTDAERLVECAGRTCYDSYGKGRASKPYHAHIMEVDHGSVTEHATLSFFISSVSRGLTHELVRHRVGVAISQRSTRYVDEDESPWIHHPLVEAFIAEADKPARAANGEQVELSLKQMVEHPVTTAKHSYRFVVAKLEAWLISKGADKFTARKQARGAARGYLGNALQTELVWTVNIRALKQVLSQRAKAAADAEIRLFACQLYEAALPFWPTYLGGYQRRECPDGLGYELFLPDSPVEKLRVLQHDHNKLAELAVTLAEAQHYNTDSYANIASEIKALCPDVKPRFYPGADHG